MSWWSRLDLDRRRAPYFLRMDIRVSGGRNKERVEGVLRSNWGEGKVSRGVQSKPDAPLTNEMLEVQFRLESVHNLGRNGRGRWTFPPIPIDLI